MLNSTSFKADLKTIARDPILVILFTLPAFYPIIFKLLVKYLTPVSYEYFSVDLTLYYSYILSLAIIMAPFMLGTVAGFLMIDERDSRIQELITITPIGYPGYITNRLLLPLVGSMVYSIVAYFIMNIYYINTFVLLLISLLTGLQGIFMAFLLYSLAADKVQGLTFAKGFGIFTVFAFADVINVKWFSLLATFIPFYWISQLIVNPNGRTVLVAITIHLIYLCIFYRLMLKK